MLPTISIGQSCTCFVLTRFQRMDRCSYITMVWVVCIMLIEVNYCDMIDSNTLNTTEPNGAETRTQKDHKTIKLTETKQTVETHSNADNMQSEHMFERATTASTTSKFSPSTCLVETIMVG